MKATWQNAEAGDTIGREKQRHTPGPWKCGKGNRIEALHNDKGGKVIVIGEDEIGARDFKESCRNARLIAAAPELLEACRFVVDTVLNTGTVSLEDLDIVKAAIQKAEAL